MAARLTGPLPVRNVRAVLYALAITALVLYAPTEQHVFIYQGF